MLPAFAFVLVLFVLGRFLLLHTAAQFSPCETHGGTSTQSPCASCTFLCFDFLLFELLSLCLRFTPLLCSRALISALTQDNKANQRTDLLCSTALVSALMQDDKATQRTDLSSQHVVQTVQVLEICPLPCAISATSCSPRRPTNMIASHLVFPLPLRI